MTTESSGMDIRVHPLVVMSVADHHTRCRMQFQQDRAIGALFGVQNGREVELLETLEIAFEEKEEKKVEIDHQHFEADLKLYKEAFPNYECLGWYTTGKGIRPNDARIHEQMMKYNERPLFLLMNPEVSDDARELPLTIYEEAVHVSESKSTQSDFVKTDFQIKAEEAERISAVHCAKVVVGHHEGSQTTPHVVSIQKAIKNLRERVTVLRQFLVDVEAGKIQADHNLLREVRGICNNLPVMDSATFNLDLLNEYNDALFVTYLAAVTKGAAAVNDTVIKFNSLHGGSGRRAQAAHGLRSLNRSPAGF